MKKEYISDVWQLKQKGHENFEFVDVAVNDDNLLFIDPCLIERWNNAWAIKAMKPPSAIAPPTIAHTT